MMVSRKYPFATLNRCVYSDAAEPPHQRNVFGGPLRYTESDVVDTTNGRGVSVNIDLHGHCYGMNDLQNDTRCHSATASPLYCINGTDSPNALLNIKVPNTALALHSS